MLWVMDPRVKWIGPCLRAAASRGIVARSVERACYIPGGEGGMALLFVHAEPDRLAQDVEDARGLPDDITLITDLAGIETYDKKREQMRRWGRWMPPSAVVHSVEDGLRAIDQLLGLPVISKADVGASSRNVRILATRAEAEAHLRQLLEGPGIEVNHCDGIDTITRQKGYAILQQQIRHVTTYRVNAVGRWRAVFHRFNYPDRPLCQTGNVEPVEVVDTDTADLLQWADRVFADMGTQWCAIDVLRRPGGGWYLLESSQRWPWPSPGRCNDHGRFFIADGTTGDWNMGRAWIDMWLVLMDEIAAGTWDASISAAA